ncbi:F4 family fimbrial subunit, partial [Escherichia sp. 14.0985]|uniref:F4 family fimbrial subunit n=2 Tax=Escherichia TaxID=561 RepID=UPI001F5BD1AC
SGKIRITDFSLLFMKYQGIYFMKKTLIALAVAASAAVSGSAMAAGWEQNGSGGSVDLGGTLTPADVVTPWEVKVGNAVTGLDALVQKGQTEVRIETKTAIPVLGIRNASASGFTGKTGIAPQINFNGAVDVANFSASVTTVKTDVQDASGNKIGSLTAPFSAGAVLSAYPNENQPWTALDRNMVSSVAGGSFYGGLPKSTSKVLSGDNVLTLLTSLDSEYTAKFVKAGKWDPIVDNEKFADPAVQFYATYGSGIEAGKQIKITLDTPVANNDAIVWKASLPVQVTYQ